MARDLKEEEGKRYSLTAKTSYELNQALKEASRKSGRSVSQEVELRLEKSFIEDHYQEKERQNLVAQAIQGDEETKELMRAIASAVGAVIVYTGKKWQDDIYTRYGVASAIEAVVRETMNGKPVPDRAQPANVDEAWLEKVTASGRFFGRMVSKPASPEFSAWLQEMIDATSPEANKAKR